MRPHGSATQLEARRRHALELLDLGTHPRDVASQLGVTRRSVTFGVRSTASTERKRLWRNRIPGVLVF